MSQVAVAEVPVVPILKGLRRKIVGEVESAERGSSNVLRRGLTRSATEGGAAAGRGLRAAFSRTTGGMAEQLAKQLRTDVAKAAQALGNSRIREADAAGAVRIAETQLAEARAKHASDSSQVVRAEERLASTLRRLEAQQGVTAAATERLSAAQERLRDSVGSVEQASRRGLGSFRQNLANLLAPVSAVTKGIAGIATRLLAPVTSRVQAVGRSIAGTFQRAAQSVGTFGLGVAMKVVRPIAAAENMLRAKFAPQIQAVGRFVAPLGRSFQGAFGLAGQAIRGLSGIASSVASGIGSAFSSAMAGVRRVAQNATQAVGSAFKAVGATVAVAVGSALVGGFNRLSAIENAKARMDGLGLSTEQVARTMDIANEAASGTAFSLDEMASAAALALTGGVQEDQLGAYLNTIKSAATAANAPLTEVAQIFGKAQTSGRAYTQEINQLADRQIPIWKALQEQMGLTAEETRKAVSDGEVDMATFQAAVDSAVGGMATSMGNTTTSIVRNTRTALSRFGAGLLEGVYPIIGPLFRTITKGIDAATAALKPFFAAIGERMQARVLPALERLGAFFDRLKESFSGGLSIDMSGLGGVLATLAPLIGAVLGALGPLMARLPLLGGMFAGITGPVGLLAGGLVALLAVDPSTLAQGFETIVPAIVNALTGIVGKVVEIAPQIIGTLLEQISTNLPVLLEGITSLATGLVTALIGLLPQIVGLIVELAPMIATTLIGMVPDLVSAGLTLFQGLLVALVELVPTLIQSLIDLLPVILTTLIQLLPVLIEGALNLFMGLVLGLVQAIPQIVTALVGLLPVLLETLIGMLPQLVEAALNLFLGLVLGLLEAVPQLLLAIVGMLPQIIETLIGIIPMLIEAAPKIITGLIDGLVQAWPTLIAKLGEMGPEIVDAILALGPKLLDAGAKIMESLIQGIKDSMGAVGEAVGGVMDWIGGFFPHSPAKRGPFSGSGWAQVGQSGGALFEQFAGGMESARRAVDVGDPDMLGGSGRGRGGGSGTHIEQHNTYANEDPKVAAKLSQDQLDHLLRSA